jgi:hypothetical protein
MITSKVFSNYLIYIAMATPHIEKTVYPEKRIGRGGFGVTVWEEVGTPKGGPVFLLAPGWSDENGTSRKPLAQELAANGLRTAIVEHTSRVNVSNLWFRHARRQRAMDIHGAVKFLKQEFDADVTVEVGHSFGGPNINDATNHDIKQWRRGDPPIRTVVVHEASPGLGNEPFNVLANLGSTAVFEGLELISHPRAVAALFIDEIETIPDRVVGILTTASEFVALHDIHIQPGKERLQEADIPVFSVFYDQDYKVPVTEGCIDEFTTTFPGGHLSSFYDPKPLANHLINDILPKVGY